MKSFLVCGRTSTISTGGWLHRSTIVTIRALPAAEATTTCVWDCNCEVLAPGGVGRYLKQTNNWILKVTGGMGVMRERFADTDSAQVNVEGLTALNLDFFRFEGNERDISANVYFWPSLTDFGRVRLDFDATLRYKIFKDFTWGFSFWNNFDSQPATDAGKNDFGLSSTIGYKF